MSDLTMSDFKLYCVIETVETEVYVIAESPEIAKAHVQRHGLMYDVENEGQGSLSVEEADIDNLGDDSVWDDEAHVWLDREEAREVLDA